jgi:hypothetical protein
MNLVVSGADTHWYIRVQDCTGGISHGILTRMLPCEKESIEVRITQNMRKERKNPYQKLKRSQRKDTYKHKKTYSKYFDGHRCLFQSEESKYM